MKIKKVEVDFPVPVELPLGWEQALDALVGMVCKQYEAEHPTQSMWPAGYGSKPLWREPKEPEFDESVFYIQVAEREASERELARRARQREEPSE